MCREIHDPVWRPEATGPLLCHLQLYSAPNQRHLQIEQNRIEQNRIEQNRCVSCGWIKGLNLTGLSWQTSALKIYFWGRSKELGCLYLEESNIPGVVVHQSIVNQVTNLCKSFYNCHITVNYISHKLLASYVVCTNYVDFKVVKTHPNEHILIGSLGDCTLHTIDVIGGYMCSLGCRELIMYSMGSIYSL